MTTDTSIQAYKSIDITSLERKVLDIISSFGERGCISDEVREKSGVASYSSITARYRSLLDKGLIKDTGERKPGHSGRMQRVMKAN